MKRLSRSEMKKVMGGNPPVQGCYAVCAVVSGPPSDPYNLYATIPVSNCENVICFGGSLVSCSCSLYPA